MKPSYEEIKQYQEKYRMVPVIKEIYADTLTPIQVFLKLKQETKECFLLESINNGNQWARYSFIGINPYQKLVIEGNTVSLIGEQTKQKKAMSNPMEYIKEIIELYNSPKIKGFPPLTGGLVGYLAYDTVRYTEKTLQHPPIDHLNMPDGYFLLCKEIIAFDHLTQKLLFIHNLDMKRDLKKQYEHITSRVERLIEIIHKPMDEIAMPKDDKELKMTTNMTKDEFMDKVIKAKQAIRDGEIFQIVLSRRIEVENPPEAFEVYRNLRANNPSPYMYYFQLKDQVVVGSSPEMLVKVEDTQVTYKPIAGTAKRGKTLYEDEWIAKALLADEKECAEHKMLVDLGRNDLGRVCRPSTVRVTDLMHIEKASQVMHMVTDLTGQLQEGKSGIDALMSVLPAGTLSGAPKVRAMELIDQLEPDKRCMYGGTIGYIGFNGDLDTCIVIRTILYRLNKAYIQAGAGIVADSIPEKEFEETHNKVKAMISAIKEVGKEQ